MSELILGTAQFGDAYGVLNQTGALSDDELRSIAQLALDRGIRVLDTSPFYGSAEARIQGVVAPLGELSVVTKFALPDGDQTGVPTSLVSDRAERLHPARLAGLLFHRVDDLRDPRVHEAWAVLTQAHAAGLVGKIGASIYSSDDLEAALTTLPGINLLQLPGSVVDRRLLAHPLLERFHNEGGTIHVRSAYLQGLLLSEPDKLPSQFRALALTLNALRAAAREQNMSVASLLLGYLKHHPMVDGVVVGALSKAELQETLDAWERAVTPDIELPDLPDEILDPRLWRKEQA